MKITTNNNWFERILPWGVALLVCGVVVALFWLHPPRKNDDMQLLGKNKAGKRKAAVSQKVKDEQSHRALPADYARQLVKQSEVLIRKDLEMRLKKFQEMADKMKQQRDGLLDKVEGRKLPPSAPADANNTSMARNIPQAGNPPLGADYSVSDLYEMLRQYEVEIQSNHIAVSAAKQSLSKGLSFPEVYNSLKAGSTRMPSFDALIQNQINGGEWARSGNSNASAGLYISSTHDLNNYRGLLSQASLQAGLASTRLEGLFGPPGGPGNGRPGNGQPGSGIGEGGGNGYGEGGGNYGNTGNRNPIRPYDGPKLNQDMVLAQAMPGRRFSKRADRKGWLYVNTWYMIGPWENYGRDDFVYVHPPEVSIDLDAVYTDGQRGKGVAETGSHPLKIYGDEVYLDGTLRWKFMQSESMHNKVPVTTDHSTYYAYTELYFDESIVMLVAIGTDDCGKVWINGKEVWQDNGTSWYHIDEHIAPFQFHEGWNRVLLRLENSGGGPAGFSFLICPGEARVRR